MSGNATGRVRRQVVQLRKQRGWTAANLAERCAAIGAPTLNRSTISNIESGRRKYVDISEGHALATALGVAPQMLLCLGLCDVCKGTPPHGFTCNNCGAQDGGEPCETLTSNPG